VSHPNEHLSVEEKSVIILETPDSPEKPNLAAMNIDRPEEYQVLKTSVYPVPGNEKPKKVGINPKQTHVIPDIFQFQNNDSMSTLDKDYQMA